MGVSPLTEWTFYEGQNRIGENPGTQLQEPLDASAMTNRYKVKSDGAVRPVK
jgi:hypothetical protein